MLAAYRREKEREMGLCKRLGKETFKMWKVLLRGQAVKMRKYDIMMNFKRHFQIFGNFEIEVSIELEDRAVKNLLG